MPAQTPDTILVVDDQERNLQVVGTTLSAFGYEIMAATNGEQALERVKARTPDLILLDILMPDMDGFEVCEALKEIPETTGIPIIFLSASDEKNMIVKALEAGGVDYVTKPFNQAELLARVRTHLELKHTRDQLADLIRHREEFVGMMAHDLKNPLGGVQFSAQLLAEMKDELPENVIRMVESIGETNARAINMINQFLDDIRAAGTEMELSIRRIDLIPVIDEAVNRHASSAIAKSIAIRWDKPEGEAHGQADWPATARILDNLISNAIKFTPRGKEVKISFDPNDLTIEVTDQGPGFTPDDREKLFKQFTRLSAKPTGDETSTGLGLSIVHRLVEMMDAKIEVPEPPEDWGACIRVTFAKE